jgi:hypothetical protein
MNPSPQFLDFELQVVRNTVGVLEVQILDSPRDRPAAPFQPPCAFAAGYLVDVKAGTEITVRQRSPRGTDDWRAAGPRFGRPGLARVPSPIPSRQQPTSKRRASTSPRQPPMFGRRAIARKSRQPWMSIARDRARSPTTSESPARDRAAVQPSRKPVPRDRAAPPRVKIPRRATAHPLRQPRLARRAGARCVRRPLRAASRDRAPAPSTLVEKSANLRAGVVRRKKACVPNRLRQAGLVTARRRAVEVGELTPDGLKGALRARRRASSRRSHPARPWPQSSDGGSNQHCM